MYILKLIIFCVFISTSSSVFSQTIKFSFKNMETDTISIGRFEGSTQILLDTLNSNNGKDYYWKIKDPQAGQYFVFMKHKMKWIPFLLDTLVKDYQYKIDYADLTKGIKTKKDFNTKNYYDFYQEKARVISKINKLQKEKGTAEEIKVLKKELEDYKEKIIQKDPNSIVALFFTNNTTIIIPDSIQSKKEKLYYLQGHWFDHYNFDDDRIIGNPSFEENINYFFHKLHYQKRDSLKSAVDKFVSKFNPTSKNYKFVLETLLNKTFKKEVHPTFDAVHYYIIYKYYLKGKTPWISKERKIELKNSYRNRFIKVGEKAPSVEMTKLPIDSVPERIDISELKGKTVVFLVWKPTCSHCKKAMPSILRIQQKFKDKGVVFYTICSELEKGIPKCMQGIEKMGMQDLLNVADPQYRSKYKTKYNVTGTPKIHIIGKDGKIKFLNVRVKDLDKRLEEALE